MQPAEFNAAGGGQRTSGEQGRSPNQMPNQPPNQQQQVGANRSYNFAGNYGMYYPYGGYPPGYGAQFQQYNMYACYNAAGGASGGAGAQQQQQAAPASYGGGGAASASPAYRAMAAPPPAASPQTSPQQGSAAGMYLPGYPAMPGSYNGYRQPQIQTTNRTGAAGRPAAATTTQYNWTPMYGSALMQRQTEPHQAQQVLYPRSAGATVPPSVSPRALRTRATNTASKRKGRKGSDEDMDEDMLAASDEDDDYVPATSRRPRPTRATVEARRKRKKQETSSEEEADSIDEADDYPKRKQPVCVLDEVVLHPAPPLTIDKIVAHVDYWWDQASDFLYEIPSFGDATLDSKRADAMGADNSVIRGESDKERRSQATSPASSLAHGSPVASGAASGTASPVAPATENAAASSGAGAPEEASGATSATEFSVHQSALADHVMDTKLESAELESTKIESGAAAVDTKSEVADVATDAETAAVDSVNKNGAAEESEPLRWSFERAPVEGCERLRKYVVKWKGLCHLKNELWTYEELVERNAGGIKKLQNYMKKQEELEQKKLYCGEDEIEQINIAIELQRQLDQDAQIPDRIVTDRSVEPTANVPPSGRGPVAKEVVYLVKWQASSYDQATWETGDFLREQNFDYLLQEYQERESRATGIGSAMLPLNQHDLSETSFEPYRSTPWYMGSKQSPIELRDYQLVGVNWIISRMKKDLSVLLADEMGLGKTAQTITVIGHLLFVEKIAGPILLIVPQSTMDNWLSEFKKWLPKANVILYHGNPQAREVVRREEMKIVKAQDMSRQAYESFRQPISRLTDMTSHELKTWITNRTRFRCDVVISTPSIFQWGDDLVTLRNVHWYMIAVDEAHQLKNRESKRFRELCEFRARYKLLLSGTPLHNNLEELWSLLHFMNPSIYGDLNQFKLRYSEVEKTQSTGELKQQQLATLQKDLSNIVLRRVKKDVLKSLPSKVEWILRVELSPAQSKLCQDVVLRNYEALSKSTGGTKVSLQNICVELKKICNHPFLIHAPDDRETYNREILWSSGKMCLLDKLLRLMKDKGHRVLIFSQMVKMLNILSTFLTLRGFKHQRLDGTMSRDVRKKAMDQFNAPDSEDFCFLLSTKAGGLGINLTTADTVIIYDSDWNPQNDLQAEARAHRIGQTKPVQIYRVVTKDSVEEDILERAKAKMVLDALVVQGLNTNADSSVLSSAKQANGFSREELAKILKFGATKLWQKGADGVDVNGDPLAAEIDLDKVLAEAEPQQDDLGSRAGDLLNSYSNVTDFRYEGRDEDKLSWDSVVPLEERLKFQEKDEKKRRKEAAPAVKQTRAKLRGQ
ncbi:DNA helicase [Gregarina niphandrodes]|uniref:DNA helicase n=1 Tax=Gregarina niphandrodes TaxID=110365 RepID=A0A023B4L8_GRENI|nr:DNA helicase [Gregarina niphandrodes]EZG56850.1 DNA helicase [Gregarina niphandrodes]|eukprot:XP_011131134.1 DNA helicase [Gregarina niphandrodes]